MQNRITVINDIAQFEGNETLMGLYTSGLFGTIGLTMTTFIALLPRLEFSEEVNMKHFVTF